MSLKYSNTTADRLDWDDMLNLVRNLSNSSYIYLLQNLLPTPKV